MNTGKLTNEQLFDLVINRLPKTSPSTLVGASIGADCAWLNLGDKILVSSSDPITAGGKQSGTLAIHVSCNDIASCGIRPSGILFVIIAPSSCSENDITEIVDQASAAASALGVDIVGGHTEVNDTVKDFVVITTAFGIIDKSHPVPFGKAKVGDKLIMTKSCGIEGSYIAANSRADSLFGVIPDHLIAEARSYNSLISVVKEGEIAGSVINSEFKKDERGFYYGAVDLMHDITEGGVFGAAYEMAHYSGIGITIDQDSIPITEATSRICEVLRLDPYRLISSGSLLMATSEADRVLRKLFEQGIDAHVIGEFTEEGYMLRDSDGNLTELMPPRADEIYKL